MEMVRGRKGVNDEERRSIGGRLGRACECREDQAQDRDEDVDEAGGNASMQEINGAAKERKTSIRSFLLKTPPSLAARRRVEGRERDGQSDGLGRETGEGVTKGKMQEEGGRAG